MVPKNSVIHKILWKSKIMLFQICILICRDYDSKRFYPNSPGKKQIKISGNKLLISTHVT